MPADLGFIHRYVPPDPGATGTTLLVLHGTGGDENDLVPLGRELLPGAGVLSPRGQVSENGMSRFFRRLAEGVFDLEDLARRSDELVRFVDAAATEYGFDRSRVVALGFSNGANIAASVLLKRGPVFAGAILLAPMLPFDPGTPPSLDGVRVFIGAGEADTMVPPAQTRQLAATLRGAGADVTEHWHTSGHTITHDELRAVRAWLKERTPA